MVAILWGEPLPIPEREIEPPDPTTEVFPPAEFRLPFKKSLPCGRMPSLPDVDPLAGCRVIFPPLPLTAVPLPPVVVILPTTILLPVEVIDTEPPFPATPIAAAEEVRMSPTKFKTPEPVAKRLFPLTPAAPPKSIELLAVTFPALVMVKFPRGVVFPTALLKMISPVPEARVKALAPLIVPPKVIAPFAALVVIEDATPN